MQPPPSDQRPRWQRLIRAVPGATALGRRLRTLLDPDLSAIARLRANHADELLQPWPDTLPDRYPELFAALAAHLAQIERPRILSFGCSTGEEVFSLRRHLPRAEIVGIDLNPRALARARTRLAAAPDPGIRFELAGTCLGQPASSFDAILALAVLRHGVLEAQRPLLATPVLPFARFATVLAELDSRLRPGGWLAVWNNHFRVTDTGLAAGYDAHSLAFTRADPLTLLYGPDDRLLGDAQCSDVLFQKRGHAPATAISGG